MDRVEDAFHNKRILLAPLRYGAGLKGKIFDAMIHGVPVCTSEVGAEGMYIHGAPNGLVSKNDLEFIDNAIQLYLDQELWNSCQQQGFELLSGGYNRDAFAKALKAKTSRLILSNTLSTKSFEQKLLNYHSFRHLKFKSRWIEVKNI